MVEVADDGIGGADPAAAPVYAASPTAFAARDGLFTIESEPGAGTRVHAEIPLAKPS